MVTASEKRQQITSEVAARIAARRVTLGLTQTAAARRLGCSRQHWSQIESGSYAPSAVSLVDIARALETSASGLLAGV